MNENAIRILKNDILNRIFAGYISTKLDVLYFVGKNYPYVEVGDLLAVIEDLEECGKIM